MPPLRTRQSNQTYQQFIHSPTGPPPRRRGARNGRRSHLAHVRTNDDAAGARARRPAMAVWPAIGVLQRVRRAPGGAQERQEPLLRRLCRGAVPPLLPWLPHECVVYFRATVRQSTYMSGGHLLPTSRSQTLLFIYSIDGT